MRIWACVMAGLLVLGLGGMADAKGKAGKPAKAKKHHVLKGTVTSVAPDGKSLVVRKKHATASATLGESTKVLLKSGRHAKAQPGTTADLKKGKKVTVRPAKGTAKTVVVHESHKKAKAAGKHKKV